MLKKPMIRVFNTRTKKKELLKKKSLKLFVCGPTVYDFAHIGHARTYIAFDGIVKYLRSKGRKVFYLQNITDMDDKIIQRARDARKKPQDIARAFEKEYLKDMKSLRVTSPDKYARATAFIKEIQSQVKRLLNSKYAYVADDGVYYDISKFQRYGKLSGRTSKQAEDAVSRIDDSLKKRNKGDFALWKFSQGDEPTWPSPWGKGRPGWHIEDTAITEKYLGFQYDIHGGARDLLFPHHEAEIAQMEAISGKNPFVKIWMHTGFLTIEGQKMSKSQGNFITIQDFLKEHSVRFLRFLILKSHYRSPIDYSKKLMEQTEHELGRIDEFICHLQKKTASNMKHSLFLSQAKKKFAEAMEDDFNTPRAISALFECVSSYNKMGTISTKERKELLQWFRQIDVFFGFLFSKERKNITSSSVKELLLLREQYRKQQNWAKADEIRERVEKLGWSIEDTDEGPQLKRK